MEIIKRLAKDIIMLALVMMLCCYTKSYSQYKQEIQATEKVKKNEIPRFYLIPKVGLNMAMITFPETYGIRVNKKVNSFWIGYHIGLTWEKRLKGNLAINTGLLLSNRGGKFTETFESYTWNDSIAIPPLLSIKKEYSYNVTYLDIPLDLKYYVHIKNTLQVFVNAGAYLGVGLFGTETRKYIYNTSDKIPPVFRTPETTRSIIFGGGTNSFPSIDGGINIGAGVEYKNISLSVNNQMGSVNFFTGDFDMRGTQYVLQISLGYRFRIGKQK